MITNMTLRHSLNGRREEEMTARKKRLAAVGFCCADVYDNTGEWYPTGNGIDWGIHLSRMGYPVSAVSVTGDDEYGRKMREALLAEGMNISHLRTEHGMTAVTHMELRNGTDRVHLETVDGVMESYRLTEEEFSFAAGHDLIHTDLFGQVLSYLPAWKEKGVKLLMDFSVYSKDPEFHCREIFPYVDYVFFSADGIVNEDEAPALDEDLKEPRGMEELLEWIREIKSFGPKLVTATMGALGSVSFDGETMYREGIVPANKVVNTVGAGDSYIAGFTAGLLEGAPVPECMRRGAALSSKVIGHFRPY